MASKMVQSPRKSPKSSRSCESPQPSKAPKLFKKKGCSEESFDEIINFALVFGMTDEVADTLRSKVRSLLDEVERSRAVGKSAKRAPRLSSPSEERSWQRASA